MGQKIVLASTSPFRRQLMQKLQIEFEVDSPDIDEQANRDEPPKDLVFRLAQEKANVIAKQHTNSLIIGSDQVAVITDEIGKQKVLGKPGNFANAVEQLKHSSGKCVTFYTGLCLLNSTDETMQTKVSEFKVCFRNLTQKQIENYLHKEEPYNCAGSFKSEGLGIALFERMIGDDPNSLIGLPLIELIKMLEAAGVEVL